VSVPDDAFELLPPEAIAFWASSGTRFGEDLPAQLEDFLPLVGQWRSDGMTELEIACAFARMLRLAREEQLGVIERVTLDDGSALIVEIDTRRYLPLLGPRRLDITVGRLATGLCGLALIALLLFVFTDSVDAWMPNVATSALTLAGTITVVERLLRREEQRRLEPRLQGSLNRLGLLFTNFTPQLYNDYLRAHPDDPIADRMDLLDRWLEDEEVLGRSVGGDLRVEQRRRRSIVKFGVGFATEAKKIVDADREVLPPELVAAVDELDVSVRRAAGLDELMRKFEGGSTDAGPLAARLVVSAVRTFATPLRRFGDANWFRMP
jgi:hypothetical protein